MTAGLAAAFVFALLLSGPAAQQGGFVLTIRPDGSTERALQWVEAVLAHQPGVRDPATRTIAAWPPAHVRNVLVELDGIRRLMRDPHTKVFPLPIEFDSRGPHKEIRYSSVDRARLDRAAALAQAAGLDDTDLVARAILLHTDIALLEDDSAGSVLSHSDGQTRTLEAQTDHWDMTRDLEAWIDRRAGRDPDLVLWYHATLSQMASNQHWNWRQAERALSRFPDAASLHFVVGCLHEQLAAPRVQAAVTRARLPGNLQVRVGSSAAELNRAAERLQRALALNSANAEARLHYGRVLTLAGRYAGAADELRRALRDLREPAHQYYGQLFLGAALEALDQVDGARTAYRAAATLFPQAQAPLLALSQLASSIGDRAGAAEPLAALATLPHEAGSRPDPWWSYTGDCGRNAAGLLAEARRQLATPRRNVRQ